METIMDGKLTANQTEERFHITLQKGKTVLITGNCYDSLVNSQEIITPMKVRKLLITGGCYDTEMYRNVKRLREKRMSVEQIGERLKKRPETIRSYLPYERVIYNLAERSVNADRLQRFKRSGAAIRRKVFRKKKQYRRNETRNEMRMFKQDQVRV